MRKQLLTAVASAILLALNLNGSAFQQREREDPREPATHVRVVSLSSRVDSNGNEEFTGISERVEPISLRLPSESDFLLISDFVGIDDLLGLQVYRLRGNRNDGSWVELSYSPKIGLVIPLRVIDHRANGSEYRYVASVVEFFRK